MACKFNYCVYVYLLKRSSESTGQRCDGSKQESVANCLLSVVTICKPFVNVKKKGIFVVNLLCSTKLQSRITKSEI
jgi:hypothetical protein